MKLEVPPHASCKPGVQYEGLCVKRGRFASARRTHYHTLFDTRYLAAPASWRRGTALGVSGPSQARVEAKVSSKFVTGYMRATVCSHPCRGRDHEEPHRAHGQEEAQQGDRHRGVHGFSRMNSNKNARKEGPDLAGSRGKLMLSVTDEERPMSVDARSKGFVESAPCPRVVEVEPLVFPKVLGKSNAPVSDPKTNPYETKPKASRK